MVAVGIEEVERHPLGETPAVVALAIVAGPIIYAMAKTNRPRLTLPVTAESDL